MKLKLRKETKMNKIEIEIKDSDNSEVRVVMPYTEEDATIYDMEQAIKQALLGLGYAQKSIDEILVGE